MGTRVYKSLDTPWTLGSRNIKTLCSGLYSLKVKVWCGRFLEPLGLFKTPLDLDFFLNPLNVQPMIQE
jgi:hypothetical protein